MTWLSPAVLAGLLVAAYFRWPAFHAFVDDAWRVASSGDAEKIRQWVDGFGAWGPIAFYGLMILQLIVIFIPALFMEVAAVLAFGPVWGALLAWSGALVAAVCGYGIGRLGTPVVDALLSSRGRARVARMVDRYGFWTVALVRFSPILSSDAVSLVAGTTKMRFAVFCVATALGMAPFAVMLAFFGQSFTLMKIWLIGFSSASILIFVIYSIRARHRNRDVGA